MHYVLEDISNNRSGSRRTLSNENVIRFLAKQYKTYDEMKAFLMVHCGVDACWFDLSVFELLPHPALQVGSDGNTPLHDFFLERYFRVYEEEEALWQYFDDNNGLCITSFLPKKVWTTKNDAGYTPIDMLMTKRGYPCYLKLVQFAENAAGV